MFRTRVIHLWLHMIAAFIALLFAVVLAGVVFSDDTGAFILTLLLLFPLALGACALAIFGSSPMLALVQRLLVAVGTRSGRPAAPDTFRCYLASYSLVPAPLPLPLLLPQVRAAGGLALMTLGAWALATAAVWRWYAPRLHAEWNAGRAY